MTTDQPASSRSPIDVFLTFLKLGLTSFGGPIAHIGYFRKELVEKQKWVSESQFGQLLAICQFLPGPASSQLGFGLGLLRAGWLGAFAAFLAFTLPSALLLFAFASLLPYLSGDISDAAIHGLKLVACVVVADAVLGMSKKLCPDRTRRVIALIAAAILLLTASAWFQILVVILGAIAGMRFCQQEALESATSDNTLGIPHGRKLGLILFAVFAALLIALPFMASQQSSILSIADIFYRAGALVFGGGHVVLPLLEESIVGSGWLAEETFLAGYGASQAIPGPMFSFAAFIGAMLPTEQSSFLGAAIALLFMFLPGFLLLAAVLPLWQRVSHNTTATNAIAGVNAAVVGLLAAALYDPIFTSGIGSIFDAIICVAGFMMLNRWGRSALFIVAWCVLASIAVTATGS